jgi:hypothetical protein
MEYESFEAYCQEKWQYKRSYVSRLISAAQVFTHLLTNRQQGCPEHETQVRPLLGLTADQAPLAWEHAVQKAGGRKLSERLVRSAVKELEFAPAENASNHDKTRQSKAQSRRLINDAIGELLLLIKPKPRPCPARFSN